MTKDRLLDRLAGLILVVAAGSPIAVLCYIAVTSGHLIELLQILAVISAVVWASARIIND